MKIAIKILELEAIAEVHGEIIQAMDVHKSARMLEVHLIPVLCSKSEFEVMKKKIRQLITKIMNMDANPH